MGWWTDLKHFGSKVEDKIVAAGDHYIPGAGTALAEGAHMVADAVDGASNTAAPITDAVASLTGGHSDRAGPPAPPRDERAGRQDNPNAPRKNPGLDAVRRAKVGKWVDTDIPFLTSDALYEIKEGGKAPTYPGLLWVPAAKSYQPDPKGRPSVATIVRNGIEMSLGDAQWLDTRDAKYEAEWAARRAGGASQDDTDATAKRKRMWMIGGGIVAALLGLGFLYWLFSRKS